MRTTIKTFALLTIAIGISNIVNAQTENENTSERLITQLKNGTAPGLLFSNERPVPVPANNIKLNEKESLITQIRKGTAAGMQFKQGGGAAVQSTSIMARVAVGAKQPLASEGAPAVVEKTKVIAPVLPKQE